VFDISVVYFFQKYTGASFKITSLYCGTFVGDTPGSFVSDTPGTFVSDMTGTFGVILSGVTMTSPHATKIQASINNPGSNLYPFIKRTIIPTHRINNADNTMYPFSGLRLFSVFMIVIFI